MNQILRRRDKKNRELKTGGLHWSLLYRCHISHSLPVLITWLEKRISLVIIYCMLQLMLCIHIFYTWGNPQPISGLQAVALSRMVALNNLWIGTAMESRMESGILIIPCDDSRDDDIYWWPGRLFNWLTRTSYSSQIISSEISHTAGQILRGNIYAEGTVKVLCRDICCWNCNDMCICHL